MLGEDGDRQGRNKNASACLCYNEMEWNVLFEKRSIKRRFLVSCNSGDDVSDDICVLYAKIK